MNLYKHRLVFEVNKSQNMHTNKIIMDIVLAIRLIEQILYSR